MNFHYRSCEYVIDRISSVVDIRKELSRKYDIKNLIKCIYEGHNSKNLFKFDYENKNKFLTHS